MGVKHIQAHNGLEGWPRLKGFADAAHSAGVNLHDQVQVILVDAEMPEMDGYVLTQHIKSDRRFDNIPVVMLRPCHQKLTARWESVSGWIITFPSSMLKCRQKRYAHY